jgi:hypothetical protein
MNIYFLVEGKRTERKLYPSWIKIKLPYLKQVFLPSEATNNCFYLISGEGYPSILQDHLCNAIIDVERYQNFNFLVIILDADEVPFNERVKEVKEAVSRCNISLTNTKLRIIVQNRCIETWLLGNRRIFTRTAQNQPLINYIQFYNVDNNDPEKMPVCPSFNTHSQFHASYLKEIFRERNIIYSKRNPGHAAEKTYFDQLEKRTVDNHDHLLSFKVFLNLVDEFNSIC